MENERQILLSIIRERQTALYLELDYKAGLPGALRSNNKSYKPFIFNIISVIFDILPFQFGQSLLLTIFTLNLVKILLFIYLYFSYI